jgi:predicted Zn-ribbon and HTH transcriptional regulator
LNKRRRGESVLRAGGLEHEEASARAVNAQPWEPMPGMVKRRCPDCRYWFAADPANDERRCPDCVIRQQRPPETA